MLSFEDVNYPCWLLDGELCAVQASAAAAAEELPEQGFGGLLTARQRQALQAGSPVQTAWPSEDGAEERTLRLFPAQEGCFAVLQPAEGPGIREYRSALELAMTDVQKIFSVLPAVQGSLEDDSVGTRMLEYAARQNYRVLRSINDRLWCLRLDEGEALNEEPLELNELLGTLCRAMQEVLPQAEIAFAGTGAPLYVRTDRELLELVLGHLVSNALRYAREGSGVRVVLQKMAGRVLVQVRDSGLGIQQKIIGRVFEPWFSCDPYCDTEQRPGGGLGLFLVRRGVQAMGGEVTLESEYGEGTTVSFTLPLAPDARPEAHARLTDYLLDRMSGVYLQLAPLGGQVRLS